VLTAAVVRRLSTDLAGVETITGGIAPSPYANVGLNVIRAIASYAGKPVALMRDGRRANGYALIDAVDFTIAPPGYLPLRRTRFSLVDVPDLAVLPQLWPSLHSIWMGAGPVPEIWHRVLNALAWTVRLRILPSLSPFAGLMYRTINRFAWGEHRGGMFVTVLGAASDGTRVERSWHMLAEGNDGPFIPSMAAEAIIRNVLDGRAPAAGARAATAELELSDYDAMFARRRIVTGIRQEPRRGEQVPLYRRILGDAYGRMPQSLQVMHDLGHVLVAQGTATVLRGRSFLSRFAAWVVGFPPAGENVPVEVTFQCRDGREHWQRRFGDRRFSSWQEEGQGRNERLMCECFGPLRFAMALVLDGGRLRLLLRRWSVFGIPLPLALAPRSEAYEFEQDGRFHFHVEIAHPLAGRIAAYRGWLVPRPLVPKAAAAPDGVVRVQG